MKKGTKQIIFSWNVIFNENSNTLAKDTSIRELENIGDENLIFDLLFFNTLTSSQNIFPIVNQSIHSIANVFFFTQLTISIFPNFLNTLHISLP
jgi:hypothetical protein